MLASSISTPLHSGTSQVSGCVIRRFMYYTLMETALPGNGTQLAATLELRLNAATTAFVKGGILLARHVVGSLNSHRSDVHRTPC